MSKTLRHIGLVSGLTLGSRVLGLGREMAIAAAFGATALGSAFQTAFTLPNLFRRLLGEGALTAALVPTLQGVRGREGEAGAERLVNEALTWTLIATGALCASAMALLAAQGWWAPRLEAAGWAPETAARWALAARIGVVLFPYMVAVCLAAVVSAALQTRDRFLEPALNPVWLNLAMMGLLGVGAWRAAEGDALMGWLCAGVLLGGLAQLFVPAAALARLGWRPRWAPRLSPEVREIARLMLPMLAGSAIYLVNMTVSRLLGLSLDDAAVMVLSLSTRVMELPIGVFAIAVTTVVFPLISKHAAEGRMEALAEDYRRGMRLIFLVNIPAAFGLGLLASPVTRVLFERGAFLAEHTAIMTPVLAVNALSLPLVAYASLALRAFYARRDTVTPVRAAGWSFAVNLIASLMLMRVWGVTGLAAASTLAAATQAIYLQVHLRRLHPGLGLGALATHLAKVCLASLVMAAAVYASGLLWKGGVVGGLALGVTVGATVYAGAVWMLKLEGRDELVALVRNKLRSKQRAPR